MYWMHSQDTKSSQKEIELDPPWALRTMLGRMPLQPFVKRCDCGLDAQTCMCPSSFQWPKSSVLLVPFGKKRKLNGNQKTETKRKSISNIVSKFCKWCSILIKNFPNIDTKPSILTRLFQHKRHPVPEKVFTAFHNSMKVIVQMPEMSVQSLRHIFCFFCKLKKINHFQDWLPQSPDVTGFLETPW